MSTTTEKYGRVAAAFTERVTRCDDWTAASPCDGWTAGDVARHVISVHRQPLAAIGADVELDPNDSILHQWTTTSNQFMAAMNDPELARQAVSGPMGTVAFKQIAGSIVLHDLLVHTWDLSVATHQSTVLDAEAVSVALERMTPMSEFLRGPTMFGPTVTSPPDADEQTRFLCFVGRTPIV
jgi:uncharacterized protein (TIGR03086 family)